MGYWNATKIVNGHPVTENMGSVDDATLSDLTLEEQNIVVDWILENIFPRKTPLDHPSSYGLKHVLERDTKIYTTNNQFKDAMLFLGFHPVNEGELNWHFCISKKSPGVKGRAFC